MSIFDKVKGVADNISKRNNEIKIKLHVTSGRQIFKLDFYEKNVVLRVTEDGFVYFDDIKGFYKVKDFQWEGREFESVSTVTGGQTSTGSIKRKGRLAGAVVGAYISPAAVPGAMVGAMLGNGNKKTKNKTVTNYKTVDSKQEVSSPAYLTLLDEENNYEFSFGFDCDSKIYGELRNVFLSCMLPD